MLRCSLGPQVSRHSSPPFHPVFYLCVLCTGVFSFKRRHLGEMRLLRLDQLEFSMCVCENSVNAYFMIMNISSFFKYTMYQAL